MNRIKVLVLNKKAEVFNPFSDIDSAMAFLLRTGYINNKTVILIRGDKARVFENITDVLTLQKELHQLSTTL
jgi:hypothetical protein